MLDLLRRGRVDAAVEAYGGDLLPGTNSPALGELAEYVAVAVREALLADPQPDAVLRYSELAPYDTEVIEVCLAALARSGRHPAMPLLKGRLAAARASRDRRRATARPDRYGVVTALWPRMTRRHLLRHR